MRHFGLAISAAALLLAGCGEKANSDGASGGTAAGDAPVKRQPGSWSTKIEIVKLDGPEVKGGEKEQLQGMMDMMGNMSICLTPEAAARDDVAKNLEQMGAQGGECSFDKKDISGKRISFAATCKTGDGGGAKMSAEGINDATSQDITITTLATKPGGKPAGEMVMRITSKRNGDCKDSDITPPSPSTKQESAK